MTPEVWVVAKPDGYYHLIVKQPYGGCFDVVKVGATGLTYIEELSTLPSEALRMIPVRSVIEGGPDESSA